MYGRCELCGKYGALEKHHIFGASNRKKSERLGLTIMLCHYCHNEPPYGVHFNKEIRLRLQAETQKKFMEECDLTTEDFIRIFGRNYV